MADVPDFGNLAQQQYNANFDAWNKTNEANRPDQYNPMGSTTWGQDGQGNWVQNTQLSDWTKPLYNTTIDSQISLGQKLGAGAPQASFGAQQNVIDAWNALAQPGLDKAANADRARAAAMGITIGSNANNDIERNIGVNRSTSQNQGILQGVDAYNKMYQNQLAGYNANRDAMTAMTGVRDSLNPNKWSASVPTSAALTPQNIYGSAQDTFNAQTSKENAARADALARTQANYQLAGSALNNIGGIVSGVGSLWNTVSGWF